MTKILELQLQQILKDDAGKSAALIFLVNLENSAVATELEKVSFHSNSKESESIVPKNVQTTRQLCSFHMLVRLWSKSFFKLGFNRMWTENFQEYKLGLEKAEEPEFKL